MIRNTFDFKTADASAPTLLLTERSADARGVLAVGWRAADSNDGGISAVVAFSGSNPPAEGEAALRARLASAEPRRAFGASEGGYAPAEPRTLGGGLFLQPAAAAGRVEFGEGAAASHLSHYVQVVASDAAGGFGPADPRLAAADFGAEVPRVSAVSSSPASAAAAATMGVPNGATLAGLSFDADTPDASVFLVALTGRAAEMLFGAGGAGPAASPAAASNLWAAVRPRVGADGQPTSLAIASEQSTGRRA